MVTISNIVGKRCYWNLQLIYIWPGCVSSVIHWCHTTPSEVTTFACVTNTQPVNFCRHHRAIKKNNFFTNVGTRIGEDHAELCVENSHKSNKTITLHLHSSSQEKQRPTTNGFTASTNTSQHLPKTSKSSRDKLYKSATQLGTATSVRPLFHSVNSYLNFNNRRPGLYNSEQYLDSTRMENPLKPLDNHLKRPFSKKLIAKYSDMEIQKDLHDFFKIRPVKWDHQLYYWY